MHVCPWLISVAPRVATLPAFAFISRHVRQKHTNMTIFSLLKMTIQEPASVQVFLDAGHFPDPS